MLFKYHLQTSIVCSLLQNDIALSHTKFLYWIQSMQKYKDYFRMSYTFQVMWHVTMPAIQWQNPAYYKVIQKPQLLWMFLVPRVNSSCSANISHYQGKCQVTVTLADL